MLALEKKDAYDEHFERGTPAFPFDYHHIDLKHPRFVMPFHYHIDHELIRIVRGGLTLAVNERHYYLREGDFLFLSDGVVHGGRPDSLHDFYECIVFNLPRIFDNDRPNTFDLKKLVNHQVVPRELYQRESDPAKARLLDLFFDTVRDGSSKDSLLAQGLLLSFIGGIFADGDFVSYEQSMSSRFIRHLNKSSVLFRYIYDNYNRDITLEELSKIVGLSPKYFCRFFKELTGCRPMDYVNRFRIDCASVRLSTQKESINQTAYACGFKDPAYFTKLFKRYKNVSPSEYRDELSAQSE